MKPDWKIDSAICTVEYIVERALIFRMAAENPTWGAPSIHGELLKLNFHLSEPTVSRWLRRAPRAPDPAQRWLTFLRNHRETIAAMDFLHSADDYVWRSLLLLCDRPRATKEFCVSM